MSNPCTNSRGAFTLIELLVVIVIIGLLAAITVPAVMGARNAARRASILSDINQLDMKMQEYKDRFGSYPPDFTSMKDFRVPPDLPPDLRRHLSGAFPRYTGNFGDDIRQLYDAPGPWKRASNQLNEPSHLDPAEALVFWLGGLSLAEGADSSKLRGFSRNPKNPFEGSQQTQRLSGMHEFDPLRLVDRDGDGWYEYVPPGFSGGSSPPYVYFHFRSYTVPPDPSNPVSVEAERYYPRPPQAPGNFPEWGRCTPYRADPAQSPTMEIGKGWVNPQSFQIISAGLDGVYGAGADSLPRPKFYPSGETFPVSAQLGYDRGDLDNLTNFSSTTLEDSKP